MEEDGKIKALIDDALHRSIVRLTEDDIARCFRGGNPEYVEADSLAELVEASSGGAGRIAAALLFVSPDEAVRDVAGAVDAVLPLCTEDCVEGGRLLFGAGGAGSAAGCRMLVLRERGAEP